MHDLPIIFMVTGAAILIVLPVVGRLGDELGIFTVFIGGTIIAIIMVVVYTNLSVTPLWTVIVVNVVLFAGIMSRAIPAMALMTAVPEMHDRGAFMSINSSLQQISGGVASVFSGLVVYQIAGGPLENYNLLGYYCVGTMTACALLLYGVNKYVESKRK